MDKKQAFEITQNAISQEIEAMKNDGFEVEHFEEAYTTILYLMCKILDDDNNL